MRKRIFSILLALCMVLCLVLTAAFAEGKAEETPVCTCETACTAEAVNAECAVCGAEGALAENCGKYAAEESGQAGASDDAPVITAADVQALIYALPEAETIGADNASDVEAQLEAIDEAKIQLSDEDFAVLDFTRYDAAAAALMALSGEPGAAFTPQTTNDHSHCCCGGSVTAGDHTSHSDVTYQPWNGTSSITYTNNTAYVYLTGNATINSNLVVDGKTLYLCLSGKTLASNGTAKIQVKNGGRLVLCDCRGGGTFKGATQSVWGGACIYLYTSTLDMFGGKLTGGKVTGSGGGGAIALDDQQCIFNMYGGEISGNNGKSYGGAIFRKFNANMPNTTGGTFNMYGGTIKGNTAKNGGAFFSTTGGTINMTGGTISGNKATQSSNDAGGGAIYMRGSGTINISGSAQITGNSSSLDGGAILMGWGTINISDSAKINNNTANRWGGAICLRQDSNQSTTLYMRGGEISGNRATKEGGAVHVLDKDCQFFLYDGKITGNTSGDGGAIYLNQEPSWLIMQGGEISGNTATGNGGGVYIYRTGSVCQLYSGKIENNKASGNGGGIYINPSNSGQLRVGNKPLVQNNTVSGKANNVYLPSGKTLTIEIGMSKGASIGVTTANTRYPVAFSNAYRKDYTNYFFADDINAHVEYKDDQKLYLVSGAVARPLTVTFDPNGGMLAEADKTKSLMTGEPYGTLPVPRYARYDFAGWYTEQNGGTEIKENTTVTVFGTQTLYAHWTPIHVHAYTQQVQKPEALKTPADCTNNAVYYLSCACGEVSTNDADTFTAANTALDHDWGEWTQNSDEKTHTRICKRDTSHTETENCSGGTASCTAKAACTVCGGTYGEMAPHSFTAEKAEAQYLKSAATCTEKAVYYKSCTLCGLSSEGTADEATFFSGNALDHDWGAWTQNSDEKTHTRFCKRNTSHTETKNCHGGTASCTAKAVCTVCGGTYGEMALHSFAAEKAEAQYLKSAATCTEKAVYYKSCSLCGLSSEGTADEATFESGKPLGHDWGAWTPDGEGTHKRVCTHDASHVETAGCTYGDWSTNQDSHWKTCTVCGGEAERLNHADPDCNHFCDTCGIKMTEHDFTGETAITALLYKEANCLSPALYYKSCKICMLSSKGTASEATFASGEKNPDRHAEEPGDWQLDGDSHWRFYTCCHLEVDRGAHQGGTADCLAPALCEVCQHSYGELGPHHFVDQVNEYRLKSAATCTSPAVYYQSCSTCGAQGTETFTNGEPLGHDYGAWTPNGDGTHTRVCAHDAAHTETENCHGGTATCTGKAICEDCKAEYGEKLPHDFTAETVDAKYLKSAATCTEKAVYYKSCAACGLSSKDTADEATFASGDVLGHAYGAWTSNGDGTHTRVCAHDATHTETKDCHGGTATCTEQAVCDDCKTNYGELKPHTFTAETAEEQYLKSAATCTEKAVYYKSCAVCGLSSEGTADETTFFSGNALDHDWGAWTQNSDEKTHTRICKRDTSHTETENCTGGTATCTAKAVCEVCKAEYGEKLPHDFTAETVDAKYLKSAATCTEKAVYYKSCAVCGLSSEGTADEATFFFGNALDHDWGEWTSNEDGTHTRTCTVDGCSAGTQTENCIDADKDHKCDICDYIISECADDSKDHKCDYCGKKLTDHIGGKATCKDKAKCEVCGAEYGELDPKNHTGLKHFPAKAATKTTEGNIEYWYCEGCGKYFSDRDGTKEIKKADTVTAKLKDDPKSPQTGDTSGSALWIALLLVSGGAAIGTTVVGKKKKYNR